MYEINSISNFLPHGLQTFRSSLLVFTCFGTKLNSIRKGLDEKVQNFWPTKSSSFMVLHAVKKKKVTVNTHRRITRGTSRIVHRFGFIARRKRVRQR